MIFVLVRDMNFPKFLWPNNKMPVLSNQKLEMANIGDVHALMLSQQVTTQQRTHIILGKIPHAILEDMLNSRFRLLRAGYE